MATEKIKKLRNYAHPVTTTILLYCFAYYFDMHNYLYDPKNPFEWILEMILYTLFAGIIGAGLLGLGYEVPYKLWIFKEAADSKDIYRSVYGGPVGLLIYFIFPFVPVIILKTLLWIIGIGLVLDLINSIVNKVKSTKKIK